MSSTAALLTLEGIEVVYGAAILAVRDVSLHVGQGEIVALLGANGAGKSSTLRAVSNLLGAERGRVTRGRITFDGRVTAQSAGRRRGPRPPSISTASTSCSPG
jgi:branched-chain amino acid transport system ATP-binding protein